MKKVKLNRLSEDVVRQIAAGEVIERPLSVVKELVDNSVDAQASKIVIKVKNGGIDLIEVSDDGIGIPKENISSIFEPHTTSKINNIEDLNTLLSMGFRGEALSTITSVAKVKLDSKYEAEERANSVFFNEKGVSEITSVAKEKGTTVRVENLFYNIPARKKYLKTATTEYRKIYELLNRYFLIYPNISFVLEKDSKLVENLKSIPSSKAGELLPERVGEILGKGAEEDMLKVFYDGAGTQITGFISHPSKHKNSTANQYIFVNNRPINDRGIVRAVMEGYSRYLPFGQKVDFVLNVHMSPEIVDVNVHPRKEEVRFENPYRVYSAVESAVKYSLEKSLSYRKDSSDKAEKEKSTDFKTMRNAFNYGNAGTQPPSKSKTYTSTNLYSSQKSNSVKDSLLFSKELFKEVGPVREESTEERNENTDIRSISQIFNKYIVVEFVESKLWVVDQHAAAERVNFEKLLDREKIKSNLQNLLVPAKIIFTKDQILFLEEYKNFFKDIGFEYTLEGRDSILLSTIPAEYAGSDYEMIFLDIFALEDSTEDLGKSFKKRKDDVLATISCHGSIRSGQKLAYLEMVALLENLKKCKNPYSCPHGRPIVWKLSLEEIDSHFERTY